MTSEEWGLIMIVGTTAALIGILCPLVYWMDKQRKEKRTKLFQRLTGQVFKKRED